MGWGSFFHSITSFVEKAAGAAVGFAVGGPPGAAAGAALVGAAQGDRGVGLVIDGAGGYFGGGTAFNVGSGIANSADIAAGGVGGMGTGSTIGSIASGVGNSVSNFGSALSSTANSLTNGAIGTAAGTSGSTVGGLGGLQTAAGADYNAIANGAGAGASGLGSALSSAAPAATSAASSGIGSYIPSMLGGTATNPSGTSLLSLGANLYSGIQGTAAAKANAAAMQNANNQALALQAKNYSATTANLSPYLDTGNKANAQLQTDLGIGANTGAAGYGSLTAPFTATDLENTPGYQFQLQQGTQALQRQQAASGNQFSGAAIKEGQQFATGLADSTYNQAYSNWLNTNQQKYGMLSGAAGSGQNAATNQGGFAAGQSNLGSSYLSNTGNITAAGNNAGNTAVNNSLAGALQAVQNNGYGGVGGATSFSGALGSSYGGSAGSNGIITMNGQRYINVNGTLQPYTGA